MRKSTRAALLISLVVGGPASAAQALALREADYDLSTVTPDADEARWAAFK